MGINSMEKSVYLQMIYIPAICIDALPTFVLLIKDSLSSPFSIMDHHRFVFCFFCSVRIVRRTVKKQKRKSTAVKAIDLIVIPFEVTQIQYDFLLLQIINIWDCSSIN